MFDCFGVLRTACEHKTETIRNTRKLDEYYTTINDHLRNGLQPLQILYEYACDGPMHSAEYREKLVSIQKLDEDDRKHYKTGRKYFRLVSD